MLILLRKKQNSFVGYVAGFFISSILRGGKRAKTINLASRKLYHRAKPTLIELRKGERL